MDTELFDAAEPFAAIDLGSNNFHVILAMERPNGGWQVIDRHKDLSRLAQGIGETEVISRHALNNAMRALERIGERIRTLPSKNVRVVGTHTLRSVTNAEEFIRLGEGLLHHQIDIISGREEARLIYLGACHEFEHEIDNRLVIDIGGGSTEIAQGINFRPKILESLGIGCILLTDACFADGKMTHKRFRRARELALDEFQVYRQSFRSSGWELALGTSGTIKAVHAAVNKAKRLQKITPKLLDKLCEKLVNLGQVDRIGADICNANRAPVLAAGLAILMAAMESFEIEELHITEGALREGLLYDLIGRARNNDIREASVQDLVERFHIDKAHCSRVKNTAITLYDEVKDEWDIEDIEYQKILRWSAVLHEIGMDVSHSRHHRHGQYLLQNLDIPGFSQQDQHCVATLVRAHRKRFPTDSELHFGRAALSKLAILLRLAVLLNRSRTDQTLPPLHLKVVNSGLSLEIQQQWLANHRLSLLDLEQEVNYLRSAPYQLIVSTIDVLD